MLNIPFFFFISIARDTMIFLSLRIDHDSSLVQTEGQLDFISAARVVCRSLKKKAIPRVPAGHVAPTLSSGSCKEYIMLR